MSKLSISEPLLISFNKLAKKISMFRKADKQSMQKTKPL